MKIEKDKFYRCTNSDHPEFEVGLIYRSRRDGCLTAKGKDFALFGAVENSFEEVPSPVTGQIGKLKEQHRNKTDPSDYMAGLELMAGAEQFKKTPEFKSIGASLRDTYKYTGKHDQTYPRAGFKGCDEAKHGIFHESDDEDYPLIRCYAYGELRWETDRFGKINVQWKPGGASDYKPETGLANPEGRFLVPQGETLISWLSQFGRVKEKFGENTIFTINHSFEHVPGKLFWIDAEEHKHDKEFSREEVLSILRYTQTFNNPSDLSAEDYLNYIISNVKL